jgi:hypothetical protein
MSNENTKSMQVKAGLMALVFGCAAAGVSAQAKPVWMKLFGGQDLGGWGYTSEYWSVDSGMVRGQGKATFNTFCHTDRKYSDFVLSFKARLWQTQAGYTNSGVQYRSVFIDSSAHRMKGYQVDVGDGLDGSMWPEASYPADAKQVGNDACRKYINANGWNHFLITANGPKVRHELNGNFCAEYTGTVVDGYIGLQLHATSFVMKVDFKDLYIRPLNNSFLIPESQAAILDDNFASAGIVARAQGLGPLPRVDGRTLTLPAAFWNGRNGTGAVRVALNDFSGRTVYARPFRGAGSASVEIALPDLAPGAHVLSVAGPGGTFSGLLR